ncbi:S9 family peptidase [Altererythrobacter sp. FM1]|uniref:S9 family peptidase n=1 Tax=Tsuneonella flava TaxID=2055955 RepID=UPI000C7FC118|nr:S9 family peptidase [Altererythrobacter sp. FM1]
MPIKHLVAVASLAAFAAAIPFPAFAGESSPYMSEKPSSVPSTTTGDTLTLERVFASPALDGKSPRGVKLSPDGRWLTVLRNRDSDRERYDLWAFDRENGQWKMLVDSEKLGSRRELSEAEKMQRERKRIGNLKGIVTYDWAEDSRSLLVPLDGDLFLAGVDGRVLRLTESEADELNATLSPEGAFVSFVSDGRLWTGKVGDVEPKAITPQESAETVHWGEAEFVAQEELGRYTGYWWSPHDKRIAVQRFDEAPVGVVTRAAIGAEGTRTYDQRYPAAGTPNALVQLFVMDPNGANQVEVDLGGDRDIYLARVDWAPDGKALYVQRLDRLQTRLDMLKVDPATGKSEVLFTEKAAPQHWINLTDDYKWLNDGSLIWRSERDGYGHLYRYASGKWTQLTQGEWVVTSLDGVDQASGTAFFTGTKDDVLAPQVYSLSLLTPGAEPVRLTDAKFSNRASMDEKGRSLIVTRSATDQPPQSYLADSEGQRITWIEQNALDADHPYAHYLANHRKPQFGTLKTADGASLHWKMIVPDMESGKRYPVFFSHYGGPHAQTVSRGWGGALEQAIVDKGYIWFQIDNRGSANRGVDFEKPIWRAMGGIEVQDQKAGAQFLKSLDYVDPDRIATYGWSYGGYMTLKMLEADQGLYAAGIAGAPVTKWELYDTAYTERYMGLPAPESDAAAYQKSDALQDATKIADPLLLIHGMSDDNVVFENSSALIAELQANALPFDMMLYPGYTHRVSGPKIGVHLWNTIFDFLEKNGVPAGGR